MARTTSTKPTPGIVIRHSRTCASRDDDGRCNCEPTFEAWVYSKRDRRKIRRSFPTIAAAKGWRIDALKDVKDRRLRAPVSITLRAECDAWLASAADGSILNKRERPYKPAVVRNYRLALEKRVLPALGHRKLADVDLADLLDLKEQLQRDGVSGSTIRNSFVPLQAIYRRARLAGRVSIDPTTDLPLPTSGKRDRAASVAQAFDVLGTIPEPERALWACAFLAGLRRGELRALRVGDVDLDAQTISVERGWDDVEGAIEPKSAAGTRKVFVVDELVPYLEPLVEKRDADELVFGRGTLPFDPRAVARKAERAWNAIDAKAAADAEERGEKAPPPLDRFTLHEARHSFSTWLDHAGVSPDRADRYMGHSSGSVASRYRHLLPAQMAEDRKLLEAYIAGTTSGKVVALAVGQ